MMGTLPGQSRRQGAVPYMWHGPSSSSVPLCRRRTPDLHLPPTPPACCPTAPHPGTRGTPWRLEVDKRSAAVTSSAFANFSKALLPPGSSAALRATNGAVYAPLSTVAGGSGGGAALAAPPATGGVQLQVVDYSRQPLSGELMNAV